MHRKAHKNSPAHLIHLKVGPAPPYPPYPSSPPTPTSPTPAPAAAGAPDGRRLRTRLRALRRPRSHTPARVPAAARNSSPTSNLRQALLHLHRRRLAPRAPTTPIVEATGFA